jgi:hypothetical protein
MDVKIYEPKKVPCELCKEKESIFLPVCIIDGKPRMYPVCKDCIDKVPYEQIKITTEMDEGYYFLPNEH